MVIYFFMQEIDLRIGATFTRFQTMLMKDAFVIDTVTDGRNTVVSYGPCQVCLCCQYCDVFVLKLVLAYCEFPFCLHFGYSSLRLDLLWKDTGRYKHMNRKSFG